MFKEYDVVVSKKALSEHVQTGCRGAVIMCYEDDEYEVEFVDDQGKSLDVLTVRGEDLEQSIQFE